VTIFGKPGGPLDTLSRRAYLGTHDEVAVPEIVAEWAEGSFRAGFMCALALVETARRNGREHIVEPAMQEAVAILAKYSDDGVSDRRAPVQRESRLRVPAGTIPWRTHLEAWRGYAAAGHGSQSAERIAERGGFSYREVQCAIAGHYGEVATCTADHAMPPGWEPR
jgi:hypothetical protein